MKRKFFPSVVALLIFSFSAAAEDRYKSVLAAEIAAKEFQRKLNESRFPDVEYSKFTSDVNNYSIGISFNKENFVIVFIPKIEGLDIEGGGAEIVVRKSDLKIVRYVGYK
jgi:hypothetical protein